MADQVESSEINIDTDVYPNEFQALLQTKAAAIAVGGHAGVLEVTRREALKGNRWILEGTLDMLLDQTQLAAELRDLGNIANLSITIEADDLTPIVGGNVTYTVTLTNESTIYYVEDITVTVTIGAGLTATDDTASAGTSYSAPTWTVGTLDPGEVATLEIVADPDTSTETDVIAVSVAIATATVTDATVADDSDSVNITVEA